MPWQLTTAISTGDLDSVSYSQVKVVRLEHDSNRQRVLVDLEYGNTVEGAWVRGYPPAYRMTSMIIKAADYAELVSHVSNDGELTYAAVKRGLYEYLASVEVVGPGVLV